MVGININMPKSCDECPLFVENENTHECIFGVSHFKHTQKPNDCPLVEIPDNRNMEDDLR